MSGSPRQVTALAVVAAVLASLGIAAAWVRSGSGADPATAASASPTLFLTTSSTTVVTTTSSTSTTTPPTTPATRSTSRASTARAAPSSGGGGPFAGLGAWVDAFDFDPAHTNGNPRTTPAGVDRMAAVGVRTLYLQVARAEDPAAPGELISPELVGAFLRRAHAHGLQVVGWYLPHLGDVGDDMRHLEAMLRFKPDGVGFDGIGLDIEWRNSVPDHATRSARLVDLSQRLRQAAGSRPVGAIVMPPVVTDVINPEFWPDYPWHSLAPLFEAWLPMSYWTNRAPGSEYRDAHRYTSENIRLLRRNLGNPSAPVQAIGGIGDKATSADYKGFRAACVEQATIGCSLYDWGTASSEAWAIMRG